MLATTIFIGIAAFLIMIGILFLYVFWCVIIEDTEDEDDGRVEGDTWI